MAAPSVRLALVVDDPASYDESNTQVVDIVKVQPFNSTIYLIETKPFNNKALENGAGERFTENQIRALLQTFLPPQ